MSESTPQAGQDKKALRDLKVRETAKASLVAMLDDPQLDLRFFLEKVMLVRQRIAVVNDMASTIFVRVSQTLNQGQDGPWEIPPGGRETWHRHVGYRVNIRASQFFEGPDFDDVEHTVGASTTGNNFRVEAEQIILR